MSNIGRPVMFKSTGNTFISGEIVSVNDGAYTINAGDAIHTSYEKDICPVERTFVVGQPVLARFIGTPYYKLGTIQVANPNGTYSVLNDTDSNLVTLSPLLILAYEEATPTVGELVLCSTDDTSYKPAVVRVPRQSPGTPLAPAAPFVYVDLKSKTITPGKTLKVKLDPYKVGDIVLSTIDNSTVFSSGTVEALSLPTYTIKFDNGTTQPNKWLLFSFDPTKTLSVAITTAGPPIPLTFASTTFQVGHRYMLQITPYVENYITNSTIICIAYFLGQNTNRLIFRDDQATVILLHPDQIYKSQEINTFVKSRSASFEKKKVADVLTVTFPNGESVTLDVADIPIGNYVQFKVPVHLPDTFDYKVS